MSFYCVDSLFERLHALCNLLGVVPENLKDVCGGDQIGKFSTLLTHCLSYSMHYVIYWG